MDNAVTGIANCIKWLCRVVMVWVAVAAVFVQVNALPSQIPSSLRYGILQVKTAEDLLQFLHQHAKLVIPSSANFGVEEKLNYQVTDNDSDDDDDEDDSEGDNDDDESRPGQKPTVVADDGQPKTKLLPLQFSSADSSRRPIQEIAHANSHQSSLGFKITDVAPLPGCIPRESLVPVQPDASEPHVMYWPGCVTAKRCGGCCNSDLHECQPTRSESIQVKVVRMEYTPRARQFFQYDGIVVRNITNHTDCSCQCKIKPEDCDPATQIHNNCQCQCKKFVNCPAGKRWDPIRCQCSCSASQQERRCLKRQVWNPDSCSCTCRRDLAANCRAPHWFNPRRCKCQRRST